MRSKMYLPLMAVFVLTACGCAWGWWFVHPGFGPVALAFGPLLIMWDAFCRKRPERPIWHLVSLGLLAFSLTFALNPGYADLEKIAASVERCIPSKGAIKPCLEEAETLHVYRVRASSLEAVDWRKALEGCIRVSGAQACIKDFVENDVAGPGVVTTEDIAAICLGGDNRTRCLLDLSDNEYPFGKLTVAGHIWPSAKPSVGSTSK
jgi:hypothetical protein